MNNVINEKWHWGAHKCPSSKFSFQFLSITQQTRHLNCLIPSHTYKVGPFQGLLRGTVWGYQPICALAYKQVWLPGADATTVGGWWPVSLCRWWIYSMSFNPSGGVKELSGSAHTQTHTLKHTHSPSSSLLLNWAILQQGLCGAFICTDRENSICFYLSNYWTLHCFFLRGIVIHILLLLIAIFVRTC